MEPRRERTAATLKSSQGTLQEFPDIIRPADVRRESRHSTVYHIRTMPRLSVPSRPRRLPPDRLRIANTEFEMLRNGTARRSDRPWA